MSIFLSKGKEKPKAKTNITKTDVIVAVVSELNMVTSVKNGVVGFTTATTRHICGNRDAFTSYTTAGDGEEHGFIHSIQDV